MIDKLLLTRGSSVSYEATVNDVPEGTALVEATFMVKASLDDLDEDALITKVIGSGATDDGQILNDGSGGTASLRFVLDNDDTDALTVGTLYISGVKVLLDNDFAHAVDSLTCPVRVKQPVVRAID